MGFLLKGSLYVVYAKWVSTDTLVIVRTGIMQNRIDDEMATAIS